MGAAARMHRNTRFIDAFNAMAQATCSLQPGDILTVDSTGLAGIEGFAGGVFMFATVQNLKGSKYDVILYECGELYEPEDYDDQDIVERVSNGLGLPEDVVRDKLKEVKLIDD